MPRLESNRLRDVLPTLGQRTQVMGVLNVTPDSFSDGGLHATATRAVEHALELFEAGADIIDVGGESSRPGSEPVALDVELSRVLPVISKLSQLGRGPISIDTTKAEVARQCVRAGAAMINDISAGAFEPEIFDVAVKAGAPMILMHTRGRPKEMQRGTWSYEGGVVASVCAALMERILAAEAAGLSRGHLVIDPGIGFGKTVEENLDLLAGLRRLRILGCPVLVGTSRKSFLGELTHRGVGEREYATAATVALAVAQGADLVRVHDVRAMVDVARVADAITRRGAKSG